MGVTIHFDERHFIALVIALAAISAIGIVMGYDGNNPSEVGHTLGEIEPGTFAAGDYTFLTNSKVKFGNSGQVSMYYDGTDFVIEG